MSTGKNITTLYMVLGAVDVNLYFDDTSSRAVNPLSGWCGGLSGGTPVGKKKMALSPFNIGHKINQKEDRVQTNT